MMACTGPIRPDMLRFTSRSRGPTCRGSPVVAVGDVGLGDGPGGERLFEESEQDETAAPRGRAVELNRNAGTPGTWEPRGA